MNLLKRQIAPVTDAAWEAIDEEAREAFRSMLSARRVVDVSEPHGIDFAAVNVGRLDAVKDPDDGLRLGVRRVLPLVEARVPFEVEKSELDAIERGAEDPDFDDLHRAVKVLARFEDQAVYEGVEAAGITGLLPGSEFEPVTLAAEPTALPDAVTNARMRLNYADVGGPFALVLGAALYRAIMSGTEQGYPVRRRVQDEIEGPILLAPFLEGGALVSVRGGDAEFVLGQDIAVVYEDHTAEKVKFSFLESFTFRLLGPEAVVPLRTETESTR